MSDRPHKPRRPPATYEKSEEVGGPKEADLRVCKTFSGTRQHVKGGTYKVYATTWLAPDYRTVGMIGWGRLAGMKVRSTMLISRLRDGRWIVTKDEVGGQELARSVERRMLMNADWGELLSLHEARLDNEDVILLTLKKDEAWDICRDLEHARAEDLVERGWARFADPAQTAWRHTLTGSWQVAIHLGFGQAGGKKEVQERAKLKRPGDRGYEPRGLPTFDVDDGEDPVPPVASEPVEALAPRRHSRIGMASLVLGATMAGLWTVGFVGAFMIGESDTDALWPGFAILLATLGALVGLPLSIVGLTRSRSRRLTAMLGLLFNLGVLLGSAGLVALALLFG